MSSLSLANEWNSNRNLGVLLLPDKGFSDLGL